MTTHTFGRAAACLEHFAAGLCLLVAVAFLYAAEAQIGGTTPSPATVTTPA